MQISSPYDGTSTNQYLVRLGDGQSWTDGAMIHVSHLVLPPVHLLFSLSQLLPVGRVHLQHQCSCTNSPWPSGPRPLSFIYDISGLRALPHPFSFRDAPVLRPRWHYLAERVQIVVLTETSQTCYYRQMLRFLPLPYTCFTTILLVFSSFKFPHGVSERSERQQPHVLVTAPSVQTETHFCSYLIKNQLRL